MASLRERRPGVWEIRVFTGRDEAGRPTQVSKTVRGTKREAKRAAAALESRPASHAAGRTVAELIDTWREVNEPVWSEATRRDYASRASAIAQDPIAGIGLARLNVGDVERWHARMRKAGVGEAAIRSRHGVLRSAFSQAVRWEWVGANVAAQSRLRRRKRAPRKSMSVDEVQAVIAAARQIDPLAALALRLAAAAGARRAELAALRWDDLDGDRLTIDSQVAERRRGGDGPERVDDPTKTANRRTVRLDAGTVAEIEALRAERGGVLPYLFSLDDGPAPPARIGWWWTRARARAGIDPKWRLHDLRHWSATMAIGAGADVRTVAGRLGHTNPAMTLRVYAHAVDAADQAVASELGGLLDGARKPRTDDGGAVEESKGMDVLARLGADRQAIADFCRRHGIRRLAVFGSALRDDFTRESDVDLLVEFQPGRIPGMLRISGMELELEETVFHGRRVDLRTAEDLGRRFRDRVIAEAEPVYDAAA